MKLYALRNTNTGEYVTFDYESLYEELDNTYKHFGYYCNNIFFQDYHINMDVFMHESMSSRLRSDVKLGNLEIVEVTMP